MTSVRLDSLAVGARFTGPGKVEGKVLGPGLERGIAVELRHRTHYTKGKGWKYKTAKIEWSGATMVEPR